MMSGMPLETCWAFNKLWNNKFYYKAASCWYFYWVILRCTDPWVSNDISLFVFFQCPYTFSTLFCPQIFSVWNTFTDEYLVFLLFVQKFCWFSMPFMITFFPHGSTAPRVSGTPHYRNFTITLRHATFGRNPLDEWSARRRKVYVTSHNTHKRHKSKHSVKFEPAVPASERPKTHALDRAATCIAKNTNRP
jgi:hypothetical protein